ncbi:NAD-dependent protein deacetylase, SIR2 family [Malonomonas rubra DSM 5091]|uniref:protein acetyllysine N-acetyltransferase n=1 Tax=Malonomonas rubra DSM 5091 TaxID=1122189 RepID=A0A1M6CKZ5_MALRU|nr:Sir2 family NAD-dependent protein deacetylase [Malonomonas rubra]SHI61398.1 NAD-dependent protein deacetylase, SIR2 family [Malonomonas rubra DSM 5091]
MSDAPFTEAAEAISNATAMVITAGAGMGVDSGLPDFRGNQGFWNAYPMYERLGLSFVQAANPEHFERDPLFGWGFYGHRTNLYRATVPHRGFHILQDWIKEFDLDHFVVTSNVDGQFQKAGYAENRILEVHGSIHHLQCTVPCCRDIWPNNETISIDESVMRAESAPECPRCRRVARPNILMFGDYSWLHQRTSDQEDNFDAFLQKNSDGKLVVIEMGAGSAVPTIRNLSERLGHSNQTTVIRINPREPQIGAPHFSFSCGAVKALSGIDDIFASL